MSKNARTNWNAAQRASERTTTTTKGRKPLEPVGHQICEIAPCPNCDYPSCCCVELEVEVGEEPEEGVEFGIEIGDDEPVETTKLNFNQATLAMKQGKFVHRLGGDDGTKWRLNNGKFECWLTGDKAWAPGAPNRASLFIVVP